MLVKSPLTKQYDLSSVTDMGSGAAPLSGEVIEAAEKLWPNAPVKLLASFLFLCRYFSLDFYSFEKRLTPHKARMGHD